VIVIMLSDHRLISESPVFKAIASSIYINPIFSIIMVSVTIIVQAVWYTFYHIRNLLQKWAWLVVSTSIEFCKSSLCRTLLLWVYIAESSTVKKLVIIRKKLYWLPVGTLSACLSQASGTDRGVQFINANVCRLIGELLQQNNVLEKVQITQQQCYIKRLLHQMTFFWVCGTTRPFTPFTIKKLVLFTYGNEPDAVPMLNPEVVRECFQCNRTLRELEISAHALFDRESANAMAAGLCANQSLEVLQLHRSLLSGAFDDAQWGNMLKRNQTLKVLSLSIYDFEDDVTEDLALPSFSRGLASTTLQTLSLSLQPLPATPWDIRALMEGVGHSRLSQFDLCNHVLSEDNVILLMNGILQCRSLRRLGLSDCQIERAGSRVFFEHLRTDKKLVELNMAIFDIYGDDCAESIQAMLEQNHHLQLLDMSENTISHGVLDGIARGLRSNDSLRKLVLSDVSRVQFLRLGHSMHANTTLEVLRLAWTSNYGKDGLLEFFDMIEGMQGLKELTVDGVQVTEPAASALTKSLEKNVILQEIKMDFTCISSNTMIWIHFYLTLNQFGRRVTMIRPNVSIPLGLWANLLATMTAPNDSSYLFYFLKHRIDLFQLPMSGKRKAKTK